MRWAFDPSALARKTCDARAPGALAEKASNLPSREKSWSLLQRYVPGARTICSSFASPVTGSL